MGEAAQPRSPRRWLKRLLMWVVLPVGLIVLLLFSALFFLESEVRATQWRSYESAKRALEPHLAEGQTAREYLEAISAPAPTPAPAPPSAPVPAQPPGTPAAEPVLPFTEAELEAITNAIYVLEDAPIPRWPGLSEYPVIEKHGERLTRLEEDRLSALEAFNRVVGVPEALGLENVAAFDVVEYIQSVKRAAVAAKWLMLQGDSRRATSLTLNSARAILTARGSSLLGGYVVILTRGLLAGYVCELWAHGYLSATALEELLRLAESNPPRLDRMVAGEAAFMAAWAELHGSEAFDIADNRSFFQRIEDLVDGTSWKSWRERRASVEATERLFDSLDPASAWHGIHAANGAGVVPGRLLGQFNLDVEWDDEHGSSGSSMATLLPHAAWEMAAWALLSASAGVQTVFSLPAAPLDRNTPAAGMWDLLMRLEGWTRDSLLVREYTGDRETRRVHVISCTPDGLLRYHKRDREDRSVSCGAPAWFQQAAIADRALLWSPSANHPWDSDSAQQSAETGGWVKLYLTPGRTPPFPLAMALSPPLAGTRD